ncbi:hypothetical protein IFM89_017388 [Coptis chinensis]|uniref:RNase H type-1 domain-containing protein n=1 Tax=Coptis chinensis TaxID=261450 RepID=A0A835HNC5_9MAGN|nr:hypothetical protein IFM89_017388 [Coptis chinensis]
MSVVSCNCRGIGLDSTITALKDRIRKDRPKIVFLCETRASYEKSCQLIRRIGDVFNFFVVPSNGRSWGLWLLWDFMLQIDVLYSDAWDEKWGRCPATRTSILGFENMVKLNTDGSALGASGPTSFGCVFRGEDGNFLFGAALPIPLVDAMVVEFSAVWIGLKAALCLNFHKIIIETDSKKVNFVADSFAKWVTNLAANQQWWANPNIHRDDVNVNMFISLPSLCSAWRIRPPQFAVNSLNRDMQGLYELGVAAMYTDLGRNVRKLDSDSIVVVYLGQADNVRNRLQHYGRAGSHLDHGKEKSFAGDYSSCLASGPGLFREIFARGFSIVFRWAGMGNKKLAEETEGRLLSVFDYAWNKGGNGARRPDDVYVRLDKIVSRNVASSKIGRKLKKWIWSDRFFYQKEGIKIGMKSVPGKEETFTTGLVTVKSELNEEEPIVCGLSLGDGSVCTTRPVEGRKRCGEHKGKRNIGLITKQGLLVKALPLKDESVCMEVSLKSFDLHEEKRVICLKDHETKLMQAELNTVCGIVFDDGTVCKNSPSEGRKRCEKHRGMRINNSLLKLVKEGNLRVCSVGLGDGDVCMETPVHGRKRCEVHRGWRTAASVIRSTERKTRAVRVQQTTDKIWGYEGAGQESAERNFAAPPDNCL